MCWLQARVDFKQCWLLADSTVKVKFKYLIMERQQTQGCHRGVCSVVSSETGNPGNIKEAKCRLVCPHLGSALCKGHNLPWNNCFPYQKMPMKPRGKTRITNIYVTWRKIGEYLSLLQVGVKMYPRRRNRNRKMRCRVRVNKCPLWYVVVESLTALLTHLGHISAREKVRW